MNIRMYLQNRKKEVGMIAGALLLAFLIFFTPLFNFLQSSLLQQRVGLKDAGLYIGYTVQEGSGTALRAGTGIILSSDGHYYMTGSGAELRVDMFAATGTGSYLGNSMTGVVSLSTPDVVDLYSGTGSLMVMGRNFLVDTGATLVENNASTLKFSIDIVQRDMTKPYQHIGTLRLHVKDGKNTQLPVRVGVENIRILRTSDLKDSSAPYVYLDATTQGATKEELLIEPSGNTMRETVDIDPKDGTQTITRYLYNSANTKIQEEIIQYDVHGFKLNETARALSASGSILKEVQAEMNANGMYFLKTVLKENDATGKTLVTTSRAFDPVTGELLREYVELADGSTMERFYGDGKLMKVIIRNADSSIEVREYAYAPDGSYTITITTIGTDGTMKKVRKYYDANGNFLREEILVAGEATNDAMVLVSEDKRFTASIPKGVALKSTEFTLEKAERSALALNEMGKNALEGYTVKARTSYPGIASGVLLKEFLLPYTVKVSYQESLLPAPTPGKMYQADIYRFEKSIQKWMKVPTTFVSGNTVEAAVMPVDMYSVFVHEVVAPVAQAAASSGGGGGMFPSMQEELMLPTSGNGSTVSAYGMLNFSQSKGMVYNNVKHSDITSGCEIFYTAGTMVTRDSKPFTGLIGAPTRYAPSKINQNYSATLPTEVTMSKEDAVQYGGLREVFTGPVQLTCTIKDQSLLEGGMVVLAYNLVDGTWKKIGDGSNVQKGKISVPLATSSIVVFTKGMLAADASLKSSASACLDPKNTKKTKFYDVNAHWSAQYVCILIGKGAVSGYTSGPYAGSFQPDRSVTRAELVKIILAASGVSVPTSVASTSFSDVKPSDWFAPYVETAKRSGMIDGYADGTFAPNATVNRAEAMKIILKGSGTVTQNILDEEKIAQARDSDTYAEFADVQESSWFAPYVSIAKKRAILSGKSDGGFHAGDNMTRAEVSKVIVVTLGL